MIDPLSAHPGTRGIAAAMQRLALPPRRRVERRAAAASMPGRPGLAGHGRVAAEAAGSPATGPCKAAGARALLAALGRGSGAVTTAVA
jgi:hypothetical protein